MLEALRRRLGVPHVPVVLGGLGDFLLLCELSQDLKNYAHVNQALRRVAATTAHCGFVDAKGLGSNPDHLHFSAPALRELGLRYFEEYKRLIRGLHD